jgi:hypothetical protein
MIRIVIIVAVYNSAKRHSHGADEVLSNGQAKLDKIGREWYVLGILGFPFYPA